MLIIVDFFPKVCWDFWLIVWIHWWLFTPRVVRFSVGSVALTGFFVFSDQNFKLFY